MAQVVAQPQRGRRSRRVVSIGSYHGLYRSPAIDRIALIKEGVAAVDAKRWLDIPALNRTTTLKALDLPVATFNKKVKANAKLSPAESERVVGFVRLVGQVEDMVEASADSSGFDARAWLALWLTEPLPAFGNARPIDFLDTMEGQSLVSRTLAQVASGAYA
jgi:putative toxin-antitoxin system antitoxin component (TIGR02293 family)